MLHPIISIVMQVTAKLIIQFRSYQIHRLVLPMRLMIARLFTLLGYKLGLRRTKGYILILKKSVSHKSSHI